jgi:hypothetical protein
MRASQGWFFLISRRFLTVNFLSVLLQKNIPPNIGIWIEQLWESSPSNGSPTIEKNHSDSWVAPRQSSSSIDLKEFGGTTTRPKWHHFMLGKRRPPPNISAFPPSIHRIIACRHKKERENFFLHTLLFSWCSSSSYYYIMLK